MMRVALQAWLALSGSLALSFTDAAPAAIGDQTRHPTAQVLQMLPGIAEPHLQVTLAAPLDGILMEIHVREDSLVEPGELLAVMDNRIALAAVKLAKAVADRRTANDRAKTELDMARRYLQRVTQAAEAASELEIDNARGNVQLAEVALREAQEQASTAELQLALERSRLATHEMRTPFAGRILRVDGKVGQSVTQADMVLRIADLTTLRVELQVPVAWYGRLAPEDDYDLFALSPVDKVVPGKLIAVEPVIDAGTQTFRCVFEISNPDEKWPAGFAVKLMRPTNTDSTNSSTQSSPPKHVFPSTSLGIASGTLAIPGETP